jgi:hypothetical protein
MHGRGSSARVGACKAVCLALHTLPELAEEVGSSRSCRPLAASWSASLSMRSGQTCLSRSVPPWSGSGTASHAHGRRCTPRHADMPTANTWHRLHRHIPRNAGPTPQSRPLQDPTSLHLTSAHCLLALISIEQRERACIPLCLQHHLAHRRTMWLHKHRQLSAVNLVASGCSPAWRVAEWSHMTLLTSS